MFRPPSNITADTVAALQIALDSYPVRALARRFTHIPALQDPKARSFLETVTL
jgi:hypothetical protein